jgi:hypothetical protein
MLKLHEAKAKRRGKAPFTSSGAFLYNGCMKRIALYLIVALIAFTLGLASAITWLRFQRAGEPCINFPSQDRYVTVIDKTTGKEFRVKNCARP